MTPCAKGEPILQEQILHNLHSVNIRIPSGSIYLISSFHLFYLSGSALARPFPHRIRRFLPRLIKGAYRVNNEAARLVGARPVDAHHMPFWGPAGDFPCCGHVIMTIFSSGLSPTFCKPHQCGVKRYNPR